MIDDLDLKISKGVSWTFLFRVLNQLVQLAFSILLARLLGPEEFGTIGIITVFSGFAMVFGEFGISSALVQRKEMLEIHVSTGFWLQFTISIVVSLVFWTSAPYLAAFFEIPIITVLTRIISVVFVLQAIGQTHYALLLRSFCFREIGLAIFGATLIAGSVASALALLDFGVYALAWQPVAYTLVWTIIICLSSNWRPKLMFSWNAASSLLKYSTYLFGHSSLNYWMRNGDNLLIGKFLGTADLGIYSRAYSLMLLPLNNIGVILGQVMFPSFSILQDDLARFRILYLRALRMIAFITFPMMTGMSFLSKSIVQIMFGNTWEGVTPILQILSVVGLLQSIIFPVGWIYTSLGRTREQFLLSLFLLVVFVFLMIVGIPYGLMGVTYAYSAWALLSAILNIWIAGGYIGINLGDVVRALRGRALLTAAMLLLLVLFDYMVAMNLGHVWRACSIVTIGVISYCFLCFVFKDEIFVEIVEMLRRGDLRARLNTD